MIQLLDTHQHLLYRNELKYNWTNDISILAKGDFTVEDYQSLTHDLGVGGSLFMEVDADDYRKETNFIKFIANDPSSKIKGIIASIRPEQDNGFESWLNKSKEMGVVGYRRILHETSDEMSQSETFRNNVRRIGDSSKTFDMCFLQKQLPIAVELAQSCDNTKLILNHCGVPDIAGEGLISWSKNIKNLAELPNVYCKLSGIMAYCAQDTASYETINPYVDIVLNFFGTDRIVWGSDWPVVNLAKGLKEWIKVTRQILSTLSESEAKNIAHSNAEKIYNVSL